MVLKKLFGSAVIAGLLLGGAAAAEAKDALTLQLKWVTQAQFAGYYVAKDKGFYDAEGLDVTIKAGGPDINPSQVIAGGGADVVIDWMPSALATREKGVPLVNIAQIFQKSGMMLTCRKDAGIKSPQDFKDKTLGVWFGGNEYPFLNWMNKLGFKTDGSAGGVKVLKQGFNVDPLLQKQADCVSTMTYNEYWQVIDGGLKAKQLVTFQYEKEGVATLEDGIYTLDKSVQDPAMVDKLARFLRASQKGWDWAVKNPKDSVKIVLANDATGAQTEKHQLRMMKEIAKLVGKNPKGTGWLDDTAAERTVETLMSGGSDPVITKKPEGAWTHAVIEKANAM